MLANFFGEVVDAGPAFFGQVATEDAAFYGRVGSQGSTRAIFAFRNKSPDEPVENLTTHLTPRNTSIDLSVFPVTDDWSVRIYRQPTNGEVSVFPSGGFLQLSYLPDLDYSGWDQIGYTLYKSGTIQYSGTWIVGVQDLSTELSLSIIPDICLTFGQTTTINLNDFITNTDQAAFDLLVTSVGNIVQDYSDNVITLRGGSVAETETVTVRLVDTLSQETIQVRTFDVDVGLVAAAGFSEIPDQVIFRGNAQLIDLAEYLKSVGGDTSWRAKDVEDLQATIIGNQLQLFAPTSVPINSDHQFTLCLRDSNGDVIRQQIVDVRVVAQNAPVTYRVKIANSERTLYELPIEAEPGENISQEIALSIPVSRSLLPVTISVTREGAGVPNIHNVNGHVTFTEKVDT